LSLQLSQGMALSDIALSKGIERPELLGAIASDLPAVGGAADPAAAAGQLADTAGLQWPPSDLGT
jgi:hypothetical protein